MANLRSVDVKQYNAPIDALPVQVRRPSLYVLALALALIVGGGGGGGSGGLGGRRPRS